MKAYDDLRLELLSRGHTYKEPRTGEQVTALPYPTTLTVHTLDENKLRVPTHRRYFLRTAAAETVWKWRGDKDTSFMTDLGVTIWEPFKQADGIVRGAYGWMYRRAFGKDQLEMLIDRLKKRPYGRRAVVQTAHPDYPEPCEQGFACSVVAGRLMMTVTMRSSDFAVGLPYDLLSAQMLHHELSRQVGFPRGPLMFVLANLHFYEAQRHVMEFGSIPIQLFKTMPSLSLDTDERYVEAWSKRDFKHPFRPSVKPIVVAT